MTTSVRSGASANQGADGPQPSPCIAQRAWAECLTKDFTRFGLKKKPWRPTFGAPGKSRLRPLGGPLSAPNDSQANKAQHDERRRTWLGNRDSGSRRATPGTEAAAVAVDELRGEGEAFVRRNDEVRLVADATTDEGVDEDSGLASIHQIGIQADFSEDGVGILALAPSSNLPNPPMLFGAPWLYPVSALGADVSVRLEMAEL